MKHSLLPPLLMLALARIAIAADPSVPMADMEPQLSRPSGVPAVRPPAGAAMDDFAFEPRTPQMPSAASGRDDEFLTAPQPTPLLEGF